MTKITGIGEVSNLNRLMDMRQRIEEKRKELNMVHKQLDELKYEENQIGTKLHKHLNTYAPQKFYKGVVVLYKGQPYVVTPNRNSVSVEPIPYVVEDTND